MSRSAVSAEHFASFAYFEVVSLPDLHDALDIAARPTAARPGDSESTGDGRAHRLRVEPFALDRRTPHDVTGQHLDRGLSLQVEAEVSHPPEEQSLFVPSPPKRGQSGTRIPGEPGPALCFVDKNHIRRIPCGDSTIIRRTAPTAAEGPEKRVGPNRRSIRTRIVPVPFLLTALKPVARAKGIRVASLESVRIPLGSRLGLHGQLGSRPGLHGTSHHAGPWA